ncbi:hypothetical protein RND71_018143 [Anisodus tanguticus]|uniref:Uncharacterized protein n=1 Tax=Anisodus tanguticus TaxID=243964 RepID=A0AAE1VBT0_9SOLA|nr:hypothetical protein RND71_018143 [Anisodus tanguticus]
MKARFAAYLNWEDDMVVQDVGENDSDDDNLTYIKNSRGVRPRGRPPTNKHRGGHENIFRRGGGRGYSARTEPNAIGENVSEVDGGDNNDGRSSTKRARGSARTGSNANGDNANGGDSNAGDNNGGNKGGRSNRRSTRGGGGGGDRSGGKNNKSSENGNVEIDPPVGEQRAESSEGNDVAAEEVVADVVQR